jgi:hypothetical protein
MPPIACAAALTPAAAGFAAAATPTVAVAVDLWCVKLHIGRKICVRRVQRT